MANNQGDATHPCSDKRGLRRDGKMKGYLANPGVGCIIAGGTTQKRTTEHLIQQVRKCNRKLFRGERSHIRNIAERFIKGFQRFDKVDYNGTECFVQGRRNSGYFSLRKLDGTKVHNSAKYTDLTLLERAKTFLMEVQRQFLPNLADGASLPD